MIRSVLTGQARAVEINQETIAGDSRVLSRFRLHPLSRSGLPEGSPRFFIDDRMSQSKYLRTVRPKVRGWFG
jgi:hypothetical protein